MQALTARQSRKWVNTRTCHLWVFNALIKRIRPSHHFVVNLDNCGDSKCDVTGISFCFFEYCLTRVNTSFKCWQQMNRFIIHPRHKTTCTTTRNSIWICVINFDRVNFTNTSILFTAPAFLKIPPFGIPSQFVFMVPNK